MWSVNPLGLSYFHSTNHASTKVPTLEIPKFLLYAYITYNFQVYISSVIIAYLLSSIYIILDKKVIAYLLPSQKSNTCHTTPKVVWLNKVHFEVTNTV